VTPTLKKLRSLRPVRVTQQDPSSENQKKKKKERERERGPGLVILEETDFLRVRSTLILDVLGHKLVPGVEAFHDPCRQSSCPPSLVNSVYSNPSHP
jgi:hypothetical protein